MNNKEITEKNMRLMLWAMGVFKISMMAFVKPKLVHLDEIGVKVKIKLRRRTKNHLKSMYFGAMAVGADVTAGLHAYYFAKQSDAKISFVFKAVKADFLKRATTDVVFASNEGKKVKLAFEEAIKSKERINEWIKVEAANLEGEIVAKFEMQISVKVK